MVPRHPAIASLPVAPIPAVTTVRVVTAFPVIEFSNGDASTLGPPTPRPTEAPESSIIRRKRKIIVTEDPELLTDPYPRDAAFVDQRRPAGESRPVEERVRQQPLRHGFRNRRHV